MHINSCSRIFFSSIHSLYFISIAFATLNMYRQAGNEKAEMFVFEVQKIVKKTEIDCKDFKVGHTVQPTSVLTKASV